MSERPASDDASAVQLFTDKGHIFGLEPTIQTYANIIPHFIWHDKVAVNTGNTYAHELGGHELGELADEDVTTGISFSPAADAYHQAKWFGLLVILPLDLFIAFIIVDCIVGSSTSSVLTLLPILAVSHLAPESGLNGPVYL